MKKNNRRWKDILLGATLTAVVSCMVVPVLAYSGTKTEKLSYNNIAVELDGTKLTLRDGSGNIVEPFIIDGTTYLPVRAIAEAVGLDVVWDSSTQTVELKTTDNTGSTGDYIGQEKAKTIALNHAGVSASSASYVRVELGYDNGRMEYEVEFWSGNKEYDYDIDALTGEIRSYDYDIEGYSIPSTSTSQSGSYIGQEKAKTIALNHAGVSASSASYVRVELDYDNGRAEYEVEFWSGNKEYDYSIDALTGEIRSYDYDIEGYSIPSTSTSQSGSYIGQEKAKTIALNHAGVSASSASFIRAELDYDDGRAEYEVEFWSGNKEYDYSIDALTGEIRGYDYDIENYNIPSTSTSQSGSYIGETRAKEIVRERAGISGGTFTEFKLDYDDGRAVYEGELRDGWREYSFEINATSGAILEWEMDD